MHNLITLNEALTLLKAGNTVAVEQVNLQSGRVSAVDALFLHRKGIDVAEEQIYFDDTQIAYDPDFDEQEWGEPYPANEAINLEITLPSTVKTWIDNKKINIEQLVVNLLTSQMRSDRIINRE